MKPILQLLVPRGESYSTTVEFTRLKSRILYLLPIQASYVGNKVLRKFFSEIVFDAVVNFCEVLFMFTSFRGLALVPRAVISSVHFE